MVRKKQKKNVAVAQAVRTLNNLTLGGNSNAGAKPKPRSKRRGGRGLSGSGLAYTAAPAAMAPVQRTPLAPSITLSGTDWIHSETITPTVAEGQLLFDLDVSPQRFDGTHLSSVANGFERYRFTLLEISVMTRAPTTTGGGFIAGFTPDVHQQVPEGLAGKRFVRSLEGAVSSTWYQPVAVRFPLEGSDAWYMTNVDSVEKFRTTMGKFLLVVDGAPTVSNISVTLTIRWTCKFENPCIRANGPDLNVHREWEIEGGEWQLDTVNKDFKVFGAGDGPPTLDRWYHESHYERFYMLTPGFDLGGKAVSILRPIKGAASGKGFACYGTLADAKADLHGDKRMVVEASKTVMEQTIVELATGPKN